MDNLKNIRTCPTVELMDKLEKSIEENNQQFTNLIAYELTCRIYVPGSGQNFDEILLGLGYQIPEIKKERAKTL